MTPPTLRQLTPLALLGAALAVGCSSKEKMADTTSTTTSGVSTTTTATVAAMDSAKAAPTDPSHYTDANIIAKEILGDSGEVALATMVKGKATNPAVRAYAEMLVTDHGKGLAAAKALATRTSITPQVPAGDTTAQAISHAAARFESMPKGADLDTAFVNHEIADHKDDISDANAMKGAAQNAEVKAFVEKTIPELQKHLDRAQKLPGAKS
jgi:putative membrane protein